MSYATKNKVRIIQIKLGLSIGAIGLVLNICVASFMGLCGPIVSLIAGGVAGYLTAQQEKPATKNEGAKAGALSGGIAGALVTIGQLIAGVTTLILIQFFDLPTIFGQAPQATDTASSIGYYAGGLGTGFCIGLIGLVVAAGVGAGAGYIGTNEQSGSHTPINS